MGFIVIFYFYIIITYLTYGYIFGYGWDPTLMVWPAALPLGDHYKRHSSATQTW